MTIIIPSYNQQDYLPDAIESALDQTVNCEIIVVDDGSKDSSLAIAQQYPVRVISQVNKGLASARNTGLMWAKDDWVLFLDADDMLVENAVEILEQAIQQFPHASIIAPSLKEFGLGSATITLMPNPKIPDFRLGNRLGYLAAIKTKALKEIGGYSPRMTFGYEDLHLWMNLLAKGYEIVTIPDVLWLYQVKAQSMITTAKEHHKELIAQIIKDFPQCQLNF